MRRMCFSFIAIFALLITFFTPANQQASAATASDFDPGYIISDSQFYAANSMSAGEIQTFLYARVPTCNNAYFTCLKDFRQSTGNISADQYCSGYSGASNESAADIIYKVAQSCGINPKVLLVLLEKEQGLVSSTGPATWKYTSATGMGCPDTAPCDPAFNGFFYQVYYGARSFQRYVVNNGSYNYHWGQVNSILYHPNSACGRASINIRNRATAALYIYTPYTPNSAALGNLYGTGDSCSAYGNRNFWRIFSDWFGSPTDGTNPFGVIDVFEASPGSVRVAGWAIDNDSSESLQIFAWANDVPTSSIASNSRPDVGAAYSGAGNNRGFDFSIPIVREGPQRICIYAINKGGGANSILGCRDYQSLAGSPTGAFDSIIVDGTNLRIRGWALDPDTAESIDLHVYAGPVQDGSTQRTISANSNRNDLPVAFTLNGVNHGFDVSFRASIAGTYPVCIYALNKAGIGKNISLGCKTITAVGSSPVGVVDQITSTGPTISLSGWAFDPDTTDSSELNVYIGKVQDGSTQSTITADLSRPDVAAAYPGIGQNHGYSMTTTRPGGTYPVCVYALNKAGLGTNKFLGCKTLNIIGGPPIGVIDSINAVSGGIRATGWALDPDSTSSVSLHVYVGQNQDGSTQSTKVADMSRTDLLSVYPGNGSNHGFDFTINKPAGTYPICIYALNHSGMGANTLLGCKSVRVIG